MIPSSSLLLSYVPDIVSKSPASPDIPTLMDDAFGVSIRPFLFASLGGFGGHGREEKPEAYLSILNCLESHVALPVHL